MVAAYEAGPDARNTPAVSDSGPVTVASVLGDLDFLDPHVVLSPRSREALHGLVRLLNEALRAAGVRAVPLPGVDDPSVVSVRTIAVVAQRTAGRCIELDHEDALRAQAIVRSLR